VNVLLDVFNVNFDDRVLSNRFPERLDVGGPGHHTAQIRTLMFSFYALEYEILTIKAT
jgi:hypothetical protein